MKYVVAAVVLLLTNSVLAAPFVPTRSAQSVAYSADGRLVVIGKSGLSDSAFPPHPHPNPRKTGVVAIWDVQSGKLLKRIETFGDITKVAFSPDSKLVAASRLYRTSDGIDLNEVRVWHTTSGRTRKVLDRCQAFDFSPDGRRIAVISRKRGVIYRLRDFQQMERIEPFGGAFSIRYSLDGQSLYAVCRTETDQYCIRRLQLSRARELVESTSIRQEFYRVAIAPNRTLIATGHQDGVVLLWDANRLRVLGQLRSSSNRGLQHPFFSPDGILLGSGSQKNGDVSIWDLRQRKELSRYTFERGSLRTYRSHIAAGEPRQEHDPQRFVFNRDGTAFLSGCHGGMVRLISNGQDIQHFSD